MDAIDIIELVAKRRAAVDGIVLDHSAKTETNEPFGYAIENAKLKSDRGKLCVLLIGPSRSGKSAIIESFAQRLNTDEDRPARDSRAACDPQGGEQPVRQPIRARKTKAPRQRRDAAPLIEVATSARVPDPFANIRWIDIPEKEAK